MGLGPKGAKCRDSNTGSNPRAARVWLRARVALLGATASTAPDLRCPGECPDYRYSIKRPIPTSYQKAFDERYLLITPTNLDRVAEQYPSLFREPRLVEHVQFNSLNWQYWRRKFALEDGRLKATDDPREGFDYGDAGQGVTAVNDADWGDYRVECDFSMRRSPAGQGPPRICFYFRIQDIQEDDRHGRHIGHFLTVYERGRVSLHRRHVKKSGHIASGGCGPLDSGPHRLSLQIVGRRICVRINGQRVMSGTSDSIGPGGHSAPGFGGFAVHWQWRHRRLDPQHSSHRPATRGWGSRATSASPRRHRPASTTCSAPISTTNAGPLTTNTGSGVSPPTPIP